MIVRIRRFKLFFVNGDMMKILGHNLISEQNNDVWPDLLKRLSTTRDCTFHIKSG